MDATTKRERIRERLRNRPRRTFDTSVPSPCIAVCQLDDRSGYCLGCFRDVDEIREWPILTAEEKTSVLERIALRKEKEPSGKDGK